MSLGALLKLLLPVALAGGVVLWLVGPRLRLRFWQEWARPRLLAAGILITGLGVAVFLWRVFYAATHQ
jgi:hypothetical protein